MQPKFTTPTRVCNRSVDFIAGQLFYALGLGDHHCRNKEELDGWFNAAADEAARLEEERKGREAYLRCMMEAAEQGEAVDWHSIYTEVL